MGYSCITNGQMLKFVTNQENAYHHTHDIQILHNQPGRHYKAWQYQSHLGYQEVES